MPSTASVAREVVSIFDSTGFGHMPFEMPLSARSSTRFFATLHAHMTPTFQIRISLKSKVKSQNKSFLSFCELPPTLRMVWKLRAALPLGI